MTILTRLTILGGVALLGVSCATHPEPTVTVLAKPQRIPKVRTTAYTHTEAGGRNNAARGERDLKVMGACGWPDLLNQTSSV